MSTLKHKGKGPQALTANGLRKGPVVYLILTTMPKPAPL